MPGTDSSLSDRWYAEGWYQNKSLAEIFHDAAVNYPDVKIRWESTPRPSEATFADLAVEVAHAAGALSTLDLVPGDTVAIQLPNWRENLVLFYACMQLGLVVIPIIHSYGPAELTHIIGQTKAKVLIVPDRWRNIDYAAQLAQIDPEIMPSKVIMVGQESPRTAESWSSVLDGSTPVTGFVPSDPGSVCAILFTSGTTGRPKGVVHTHNSLVARASPGFPGAPSRRHVELSVHPSSHIGGVLRGVRTFLWGNEVIYIDQWEAGLALSTIERARVTALGISPFFLAEMLDHPDFSTRNLSSVQVVMVGAASVPPDLIRAADEAGWRAVRSYGMTEHPNAFISAATDKLEWRATTDGRVDCGAQVRLVDESGQDVATGERGEIILTGPGQFSGYLNPSDNEGAFLAPGWFRTGDLGTLDASGRLTVVGRKSDMIIRGGENIAAAEVEEILVRSPLVQEAAAVGYPDQRYGERVCAVVVLAGETPLTLEDVRDLFRTAGAAIYKTPERLVIRTELPRNATGKVVKSILKEEILAPDSRIG